MKIPLSRPTVTAEMKKEILQVLDSGRFVSGPRIEQFEHDFARYCNVDYATTVSSGTAAIFLALKTLNIGPGDKVACPSFSFIATASPIFLLGAEPVFIDIGDDYIMDLDDLEQKLNHDIKAVIIVHLYGQMAEMEKLMFLKQKYGFWLIEDACQAHGAEYHGRKAGSFGDMACFSFYPSKNMTVAGDGGMVVTGSYEWDQRLKALRNHGISPISGSNRYISEFAGYNFRMSEIAAAMGCIQLRYLDNWIEKRRDIAKIYRGILPENLILPVEYPERKHAYHLYVIRLEKREGLIQHLRQNGIETGIHYPIPIHQQKALNQKITLPKTEQYCEQILSLPMFPELNEDQLNYIGNITKQF